MQTTILANVQTYIAGDITVDALQDMLVDVVPDERVAQHIKPAPKGNAE